MRKLPEGFEEKFRAALLEGRGVGAAAVAAGISLPTAYRWFAEHRAELAAEILKAATKTHPALRLLRLAPLTTRPMA